MDGTKNSKIGIIGFVCGTAVVSLLTGCLGYVEGPRRSAVYVEPPPSVYVDARVAEPDYVYYPGYQVYYGRNTHQYVYLEGRSWVSRPAPPRVAVDVLLASPSVTLDFRDHPSIHNAAVVRQYPKHWAPPGPKHDNRGHDEGRHDK